MNQRVMSIIKDKQHYDSQIGRFKFVKKPSDQLEVSDKNKKHMKLFRDISDQCGSHWSMELSESISFLHGKCNLVQLSTLLNLTPQQCLLYLLPPSSKEEGEEPNGIVGATEETMFWVTLFFLPNNNNNNAPTDEKLDIITINLRTAHVSASNTIETQSLAVRCNFKYNKVWRGIYQEIKEKFLFD